MSRQTRRGAEGVRQDHAMRDLRRLTLLCPVGMSQRILEQIRREHREATEDERGMLKDVRSRGGVCFPGGMTREEWDNSLPRSLQGSKKRCVPADELAQELYDRGRIADASQDAVLDKLVRVYDTARNPPNLPDEKTLAKEAKRLLGQEVKTIVRNLVKSSKKQCAAACAQPLEASMAGVPKRSMLSGVGTSTTVRRDNLLRLSQKKGCSTVVRNLEMMKRKALGAQRTTLGADISWLRGRSLCSTKRGR